MSNTHRLVRTAIAAAFLTVAAGGEGRAYNELKSCGSNNRCVIVDVLDRHLLRTEFSNGRVKEAWDVLRSRGCVDVADVVVGGTLGENGAPGKTVPAGFANHLVANAVDGSNRCAIVVHYELEGPVIDAQAYEDSVEHGRKALAIVLNRLDSLRTAAGKTSRLRVWGHSKGAAIVESTWRMEARNGNTKFITELDGAKHYVDACPSNNCFYFGFGYPFKMEQENRFSISPATASTWSSSTAGKLAKPASSHAAWWRLTTFTNDDDPIYDCHPGCAWDLLVNSHCHLYEKFTRSKGYQYFDAWNGHSSSSSRPADVTIGNSCGP